jgi:hypothetical protein
MNENRKKGAPEISSHATLIDSYFMTSHLPLRLWRMDEDQVAEGRMI